MRHAEPHRACPQPVLDAVAHVLEKVPLLWLRRILRGIVPAVISSGRRIKREDVDARGARHGHEQVVWHHELVIFDKPTLERDPLCVEVVALEGSLSPWKEKPRWQFSLIF